MRAGGLVGGGGEGENEGEGGVGWFERWNARRAAVGLPPIDLPVFNRFISMMVTRSDYAWGRGPATPRGERPFPARDLYWELVSDAVYVFGRGGEAVRPIYTPIIRLWGEWGSVDRVFRRMGGALLLAGPLWGVLLRLASPGPPTRWPEAAARELGLAWFPHSPFPGLSAEVVEEDWGGGAAGIYSPTPAAYLAGYKPLPPLPPDPRDHYAASLED